jgi:hypothetical protein
MTTNTVHNKAVDLLLDQKAILGSHADEIENTEGETRLSKDLRRAVEVIKYSINHLVELEHLVNQMDDLENKLRITEKESAYLRKELKPYKEVERLMLSGGLDKTIAVVSIKIDREKSTVQ